MQTLREKLKEDLKLSIKTSNSAKKNFIKVILNEISIEEKRGAADFMLNEEGVMSILKKARKNQELTKEVYENRGQEIPEELKLEIAILDSYLPQLFSKEQTQMLVAQVIRDIGATSIADMGKIMKVFNSEYAGRVDNKYVSQCIKEIFNS